MTTPDVERMQRALEAVTHGDRQAADELLPLVYHELRNLARNRLGRLPPGQTLQPTALVHEAYLRVAGRRDPGWNGKGHFFGAAAQAMRDILVENARRKGAVVHGGGRQRVDLVHAEPWIEPPPGDVLAVDEAVARLEKVDPIKGQIVNCRFFARLNTDETAAALGLTPITVRREWRYIRAWLERQLGDTEPAPPGRQISAP